MNEPIKNTELDFVLISLIFRLILFLTKDLKNNSANIPADGKLTAFILLFSLPVRAPPGI